YGAEQTDIRAGGAYGGQERQRGFQLLFLARDGYAHGTRHTVHHRIRVDPLLLAQAGEFLEAGTEDLLQAGIRIRIAASLTIQLGQIDTGPETILEVVQRTLGGAQGVAALEDHHPGND